MQPKPPRIVSTFSLQLRCLHTRYITMSQPEHSKEALVFVSEPYPHQVPRIQFLTLNTIKSKLSTLVRYAIHPTILRSVPQLAYTVDCNSANTVDCKISTALRASPSDRKRCTDAACVQNDPRASAPVPRTWRGGRMQRECRHGPHAVFSWSVMLSGVS